MRCFLAVASAVLCLSTAAEAATLFASADASPFDGAYVVDEHEILDSLSGGRSASAFAESGPIAARGAVDIAGYGSASVTKSAGSANSTAWSYAASNFTAIGSGTVEFRFEVGHRWDITDATYLMSSNLSVFDYQTGQERADSLDSGSFMYPVARSTGDRTRRLSVIAPVESGGTYQLFWQNVGFLSSAEAGNVLSSGTLSLVTHGGARVAFDDPAVLSQIPLPAAAPLLAAAVGLLGLVARRGRRSLLTS